MTHHLVHSSPVSVNIARIVSPGLPAPTTGRDPVDILEAASIVAPYGVHVVPHSLQEIMVRTPGHAGKGGPGRVFSIEVQLLAAVAPGVAGTDEQEVVDGRDPGRAALGVVRDVVRPAGSLISCHNTAGQS